jgi:hypothetical protein
LKQCADFIVDLCMEEERQIAEEIEKREIKEAKKLKKVRNPSVVVNRDVQRLLAKHSADKNHSNK